MALNLAEICLHWNGIKNRIRNYKGEYHIGSCGSSRFSGTIFAVMLDHCAIFRDRDDPDVLCLSTEKQAFYEWMSNHREQVSQALHYAIGCETGMIWEGSIDILYWPIPRQLKTERKEAKEQYEACTALLEATEIVTRMEF